MARCHRDGHRNAPHGRPHLSQEDHGRKADTGDHLFDADAERRRNVGGGTRCGRREHRRQARQRPEAVSAGRCGGRTRCGGACRRHGQCEEAGQAARPPPQPSGGGTRRRAGPRRNRCGDDAADTGPRAGQDGSRRGRWHVDRRHTGARTPAERAAANRAGHRHRAAHAGEVHGVVRQTPERSVRNRRAGGESRRAAD